MTKVRDAMLRLADCGAALTVEMAAEAANAVSNPNLHTYLTTFLKFKLRILYDCND